jgi:S-adenosylmethionine uptake transporter
MYARQSPQVKGIILMAISTLVFTTQDTITRFLSLTYPSFMIAVIYAASSMTALLLWVGVRKQWRDLKPKQPWKQAVRSLLNAGAQISAIHSFAYLSVPNAYAIFYISPVVITILSALFLREHPTRWQTAACVVGFVAMLYLLQPSVTEFNAGVIYVMSWVLCFSISILMARTMPNESRISFPFYAAVATLLTSLPLGYSALGQIAATDLPLLIMGGLLWFSGLLMLIAAYVYAPAPLVAPLSYLEMVWAVLFSYLIWQVWPTTGVLLGSCGIIAAGLMVIWGERRAQQKAARAQGS